MADVVCAVRGGPGSYHVRLAALRHAAETGDSIHFLSVLDPPAYESLHEGEQLAIRTEMAWRDLVMAKTIAARREMSDVRYTVEIRCGELIPTIAGYARETEARLVLIGRPRPPSNAATSEDSIETFVDELTQAAGVEVREVAPED